MRTLDIQNNDCLVNLPGGEFYVNLKWLRSAGRYNNGGTIRKGKYRIRLILGRIKDSYTQPLPVS